MQFIKSACSLAPLLIIEAVLESERQRETAALTAGAGQSWGDNHAKCPTGSAPLLASPTWQYPSCQHDPADVGVLGGGGFSVPFIPTERATLVDGIKHLDWARVVGLDLLLSLGWWGGERGAGALGRRRSYACLKDWERGRVPAQKQIELKEKVIWKKRISGKIYCFRSVTLTW